jgi:hypothetical protein
MKFKQISLTLAAALTVGLAGCSKEESVTSSATADAATKAADAAKVESAKTAEAAKVEAAKTSKAADVEAAKTAEAAKVEAAKAVEAAKVAEAAKVEAAKVEAAKVEAAKAAEAAKVAENNKTQGFIDKAKNLVAEGKFTDASSVLQQLIGRSLTSDQTKVVDGLKLQIQKGLIAKAADNAAGAVGDLISK